MQKEETELWEQTVVDNLPGSRSISGGCLSSIQTRRVLGSWLSPAMRAGEEAPAGNAAEEMAESSGCRELWHRSLRC